MDKGEIGTSMNVTDLKAFSNATMEGNTTLDCSNHGNDSNHGNFSHQCADFPELFLDGQNPLVTALLLIAAVLMLLLNLWNLVCLKTHRGLFCPRNIWFHYVSLSGNDLCCGIAAVFLVSSELVPTPKSPLYCTVIMKGYVVAQLSSHINVLGICLFRLRNIYRMSCNKVCIASPRFSVAFVVGAWVTSIGLLVMKPVAQKNGDKENIEVRYCSLAIAIPQEDLVRSTMVSILVLFAAEVVVINIAYLVCMCKIRSMIGTTGSLSSSIKIAHQLERRLLLVLGKILFFLDVSTLPLLVVLLYKVSCPDALVSNKIIGATFAFLSLNSLCNPVLYPLSVKSFRLASLENALVIKSVVTCRLYD